MVINIYQKGIRHVCGATIRYCTKIFEFQQYQTQFTNNRLGKGWCYAFMPMKAKWKSYCRQWRIHYEGQEINKENVPVELNSFIIDPSMENNIKSGFKMTRIFPFDANSVNYPKVVQRLAVSTAIDPPTTYLGQNLSNMTY